jgi:hypothetical protein
VTQIKGAFVPNLNVAGFWDQEDPWGPWEIYRRSEQSDPNRNNFIVAGPWFHGQWHNLTAESIGQISFGGHDTATEFREKIEAPWFRYWLHGKGEKFPWKASTFQTGSNSWHTYQAWPPASTATKLYLHRDGVLSFEAPPAGNSYVQYVSDPANPVPYRPRPISPTYPAGDWRRWEVGDQRFVENRPDVATWVSRPLDSRPHRDRRAGGEPRRVDVRHRQRFCRQADRRLSGERPGERLGRQRRPAAGQYAQSLNGYELPIAMEVRRGRYNKSYEHPQPLVANQPTGLHDPAEKPRSRVPEGPSHHGAGPVDLVPRDRPEPPEVRAEHLQSDRGGLRQRDAAHLHVARAPVARRAACRPVDDDQRRTREHAEKQATETQSHREDNMRDGPQRGPRNEKSASNANDQGNPVCV